MLHANQFAEHPPNWTLDHVPTGMHDLLKGNAYAAIAELAAKLDEIRQTQARHGEVLAAIERSLRNLRRRS